MPRLAAISRTEAILGAPSRKGRERVRCPSSLLQVVIAGPRVGCRRLHRWHRTWKGYWVCIGEPGVMAANRRRGFVALGNVIYPRMGNPNVQWRHLTRAREPMDLSSAVLRRHGRPCLFARMAAVR